MRYVKKTRTLSFLMELLIALVFFTICCLICVPLFVKAYQLNDSAAIKNEGLLKIESVAEDMKIYQGLPLDEYIEGCVLLSDYQCAIEDLHDPMLSNYRLTISIDSNVRNAGYWYDIMIRIEAKDTKVTLIEMGVGSYQEVAYETR